MPSNDEQAIEQNKQNSILDLQLTGISIELRERPESCYSRPASRSEYLTRPMSAIPMYFKERGRGGVRERPRSAGNQVLRKKTATGQYAATRTAINSTTDNTKKGRCSRSDVSLNCSGGRGGGRLEPGLAAKPPLPPARPVHTQSLDDIVNIKFLRWFPESAPAREKEVEEDEAVGRCDSSLANDDMSDLASSDSRLGFTSPDIALNTEGNLRPPALLSHRDTIASTNDSDTPLDSPRNDDRDTGMKAFVSNYDKTSLNMLDVVSYEHNIPTVSSPPEKQHNTLDKPRQTPFYDEVKKIRPASNSSEEMKPPTPTLIKRSNIRPNSASTLGSCTLKRVDEQSRSISLESDETVCNSVIDKSRANENKVISNSHKVISGASSLRKNDESSSGDGGGAVESGNDDKNDTERNLMLGSSRIFDSNESLFESNTRNYLFSTPESVDTPEPIPHRQKLLTRQSKFPYRSCRNATPDSLTTPEPCPTPEPLPTSSHHSYTPREGRRVKRVTIDLCPGNKRQRDEKMGESVLMTGDMHHSLDFERLSVSPAGGEAKDKVSDDSGVRSLLTSVDSKIVPTDSHSVSKHDEILSWMGSSVQENGDGAEVTSTYDELMNMIQVIEHDEVESIKLEVLSAGRNTGNNSACSHTTPAPSGHETSDILGLLEGVEEASRSVGETIRHQTLSQSDSQRSLTLAQRCMTLSDRLEAEKQRNSALELELKATKESLGKLKAESQSAVTRHQAFINQLLKEKQALGEQCAALVKDLEAKHRKTLKAAEERHSVDLRKQQEKLLAAEKLRRDKWIDSKTKKIKEMTVAGLESELTRLGSAHQEEVKELRRQHEEELSRTECTWTRRLSLTREESAREREAAVTQEREAAATALHAEVSRLEADQRESRRTLLQELREERQRMELQMERTLADRSALLDTKYQQALTKLDDKLADITKQHQDEVGRLREAVEAERESWLAHQTQALGEKEREVRAEAKRERDRHIEAAIRKLDQESMEKQQHLENKLVRVKEGWEEEREELEKELRELKRKLKEARREAEEASRGAEAEASKARQESEASLSELAQLKARLVTLMSERSGEEELAAGKLAQLEQQLAQARHLHQEALADRQVQLDLLYNRVKEAVAKKDEQIRWLQKERDTALEQSRQLENILEARTTINN